MDNYGTLNKCAPTAALNSIAINCNACRSLNCLCYLPPAASSAASSSAAALPSLPTPFGSSVGLPVINKRAFLLGCCFVWGKERDSGFLTTLFRSTTTTSAVCVKENINTVNSSSGFLLRESLAVCGTWLKMCGCSIHYIYI